MHGSLLHQVEDLVLHCDSVVDIVVELELHLVLELSILLQRLFVFDWVSEVLVILSKQVQLINVAPRVPPVTVGILGPEPQVFAATKEVHLVKFLIKVLPVESVGQPSQGVAQIEEGESELPAHAEGVHEEDIPGEGHQAVVHDVGVLQIDLRVSYVIARVEEQLTFAIELNSL